MDKTISHKRAVVIARALACSHCREYTFRKVVVKPAPDSQRKALQVVWVAHRICGVCGLETELGLDADGDVVFLG